MASDQEDLKDPRSEVDSKSPGSLALSKPALGQGDMKGSAQRQRPLIKLPQTKSNATDSDSLVFLHYSSGSPDSLELQKTTTKLLEFVQSEVW